MSRIYFILSQNLGIMPNNQFAKFQAYIFISFWDKNAQKWGRGPHFTVKMSAMENALKFHRPLLLNYSCLMHGLFREYI